MPTVLQNEHATFSLWQLSWNGVVPLRKDARVGLPVRFTNVNHFSGDNSDILIKFTNEHVAPA